MNLPFVAYGLGHQFPSLCIPDSHRFITANSHHLPAVRAEVGGHDCAFMTERLAQWALGPEIEDAHCPIA